MSAFSLSLPRIFSTCQFDRERIDAEYLIAKFRALLAAASLFAVLLDRTEPERYVVIVNWMVAGVAVYSLSLLLALRFGWRHTGFVPFLLHAIDMVFAAVVTLFTQGAASPFFVYFTFVVVAAAYRWGLRATIATAVGALVLLSFEAASARGAALLIPGKFELNRFLMRTSLLMLMAFTVGCLAEDERRRRARSGLVAKALARLQTERSMFEKLQAGIGELLHAFGGRQCLLVAQQIDATVFVWDAKPAAEGELPELERREVIGNGSDAYLFETGADTWLLTRRQASGPSFELVSLKDGLPRRTPFTPPAEIASLKFRTLLSNTLALGDEWRVRTFIVDPDPADIPVQIQLFETLISCIAPEIYDAYLVGRLRSHAGAIERGRLARELHDSVIQSLIAIDMRLNVARQRDVECGDRSLLESVQQLLRREVLTLRDLTHHLSDVKIRPQELVGRLTSTVDRFRHEAGIAASFVSDLEEVRLSPQVCRELVQITQEALINVRRHSGARQAMVHLAADKGQVQLTVDDDGRGLQFSGTRHHQECEADWQGPQVIKQRVRAIGGALTIESRPGRGTRLEIVVPDERARRLA